MIKNIILTQLILVLALTSVQAQSGNESRVGTTAAPFLTLGVGAKGSALGHANSVNVSGAEAIFWNPAGISMENDGDTYSSGFFSVNQYFVDVDIYGAAMVFPVGKTPGKNRGLGINYVDYGRMDIRTPEDPEGIGATFGAHDLSLSVLYAQNLTEDFHFGGGIKFIQQKIFDMTAEAVAIDMGFILKTDYVNGIIVGASITNFGNDLQMSGINSETTVDLDPGSDGNNEGIIGNVKLDSWELPLSFKFGLMVPAIKRENLELKLLSEIQQTNDNKLNVDSGSELSYLSKTVKFHVRTGYKDFFLEDNVDSHFTYGAGFTLKTSTGMAIGVDFAQVPFEYLGQTTIVDVKLYF